MFSTPSVKTTSIFPLNLTLRQVANLFSQHGAKGCYIDLFTGRDKEIEANFDKFSSENRDNALKKWNVQKDVFDYADLARKNLKSFRKA